MLSTSPILTAAIDYTPLVNSLFTAIGLVIVALGALVAAWVRSRLKTDQQRAIFDQVSTFVRDEVRAVAQTMRPAVVAALADGKISPEEAARLRNVALTAVRENLGRGGLAALQRALGDRSVDAFLVSQIESHVLELKNSTPSVITNITASRLDSTPDSIEDAIRSATERATRGEAGFARGIVMRWLALGALAFVLAPLALHGCSGQQRRHAAAATVIVSAGGAVEGLRQSNRDVYTRATDALRERVQGEEYARQSEPIDTAFRARGRAIRDLTSVLYAAARLNDTSGATPAQYARSAADILEELRDLTAILRDGSALPPIPIPREVDEAEAGLQALATMVAGGAR